MLIPSTLPTPSTASPSGSWKVVLWGVGRESLLFKMQQGNVADSNLKWFPFISPCSSHQWRAGKETRKSNVNIHEDNKSLSHKMRRHLIPLPLQSAIGASPTQANTYTHARRGGREEKYRRNFQHVSRAPTEKHKV